jgi:uncharacterized caspase-like protein
VKDKLVLALVVVLVLLAGGTIGFALGSRYGAASPVPLTDFGTAMYSAMTASAERLYGTDATYENSLRVYVALLDNLSARDPSESTRQTYAADKALSLIRLADLAEKRGSSAESTRLTSDALAVCSASGLPYCSSAELRQRAKKMDVVFDSTKQLDRD